MAQTTFADGKGIIHRESGGIQTPGATDVCLTTIGDSVVPVNYTNTSYAVDIIDGPTTVKTDGQMPLVKDAKISKSTGDESGDRKGINSGTITDISEPITYSFTVKFEGRNVCFLGSKFYYNKKNTQG